MKKETKNIEASVKAQLKNKAKEKNRPFAEILNSIKHGSHRKDGNENFRHR